ncbi:MAG TPA: hypothetical protein PLY16_02150 [Candidatus Saccharibacteria bacterium]|nr:hypothetical protein [Candidatus Saccharibacteria bacterium]
METIYIILLSIILLQTSYLLFTVKKSPSVNKAKQKPIFVDTSILIDGRIVDVAKTGFITSTLYIPRSVISELQTLADTGDSEKRQRARKGLDVISLLQSETRVDVEVFDDHSKATTGVDDHLLDLAKRHNGTILTLDFNLNKVAHVDAIEVLNLNDLAMNLRLAYLPGEHATIELVQKGNESHQAVGYLADGTMVVVEQGGKLIGKSVDVEFTRALQTTAGKMMFAKIVKDQKPTKAKAQTSSPKKKFYPRRKTNEDRMVDLANKR